MKTCYFQCKYDRCDKKFLSQSLLRRHYLIHSNTIPYKCHICNQKFQLDREIGGWRFHMRLHSRNII